MDDPIDLRVSTIGRVHPNNEVLTYYFIQHRNNWFRIWMSIIVLYGRCFLVSLRTRSAIYLGNLFARTRGFFCQRWPKARRSGRNQKLESENPGSGLIVSMRSSSITASELQLPKVSISCCLDESRQGTRFTFWKYLSKFCNYLLCVLVFPANEYMKDHICELWRKIWRHDWSSQFYTQLRQLWN